MTPNDELLEEVEETKEVEETEEIGYYADEDHHAWSEEDFENFGYYEKYYN